jgi:hypothetical protein
MRDLPGEIQPPPSEFPMAVNKAQPYPAVGVTGLIAKTVHFC